MCSKKHIPQKTLLLTLTLFIINSSLLIATVRYVSHSGSNTPPYTSWATAADSIMSAINISVFGDTIYVANGVYEEQIIMIPGLSLIGAGMDSCVIDTRALIPPDTAFTSLTLNESCLAKGFKIIVSYNGDRGVGVGSRLVSGNVRLNRIENASIGVIFNNSSTIIQENIINAIDGLWIIGSSFNFYPVIDNNIINVTYQGIDISINTRPTIRNNIIFVNGQFADGYNGGASDTVRIYNNLIIGELMDHGLRNRRVPTVESNNVVIGNFGTGTNSRDFNEVENNITVNGERGITRTQNESPIIRYNNSWNNTHNYYEFSPDTTNLSVNPMFVDEDSLDFHLQMYSPLIDAGDPDILDKDSTRSDIGLYGGPYGESYTYLDLAPKPPVNLTALVDSNYITVSWNHNTEADFSFYSLFRDTTANFTADSTTFVLSLADTFYKHIIPNGVEALYYKLTATDNQGNQSLPSEELAVKLTTINEYPMTISDYKLYQNYPNPFNPSTKIGYRLKERGYVKLYVYDVKGELVDLLVNQIQEAGYYEVEFSGEVGNRQSAIGNRLASGIYIYQIMIKSENNIPVFSEMKKMVYLK